MVCKTSHHVYVKFLFFCITLILALPRGVLGIDYTIVNNATTTPGGIVFANKIGEEYARKTLTNATAYIWKILQENTYADRQPIDQITLAIVPKLPPGEVAEAGGNKVSYSAESLQLSTDPKTDFVEILFHEMTHIWQWNGNNSARVGLIEGIADYVRLTAFHIPPLQPSPGQGWDVGYAVTAGFLMYCDGLRSGFVAQLNKKMRDSYSDGFFEDLLGKSVDQLWSDYKAKHGGH